MADATDQSIGQRATDNVTYLVSLTSMSSLMYFPGMDRLSGRGRVNRLREMRTERTRLTQAQLADLVGVTRQTINAIEGGDYAPSVYLALDLARVLACTVEELFPGTQEAPHGIHA